MGRALTDRPDLFAGAISDVGWMNPVRYAVEQNNVDIDEWGLIVDGQLPHHVRHGQLSRH